VPVLALRNHQARERIKKHTSEQSKPTKLSRIMPECLKCV
jgi:hypothetical protein